MLLHISSYDLVVDSLYLWPHLKIGDVSKIHRKMASLVHFPAARVHFRQPMMPAGAPKSLKSLPFLYIFSWLVHENYQLNPPKKIIVVKWSEFLSFSCNDDDFCEMEICFFFFSTPTKLYNTGIPVVFFRIALSWGFRECLKDFHKLWDRRLSNLTNFDEDVLYFSMDFYPPHALL